jgi:phosphatidylserine/phosphatidylglycerophosphate/cardiolipin synthase-like enzyme
VDFAGGKIKGFVGPADLGAADDLEPVIVAFIERVTKTIDVAVQELDSIPIAEALIRQKRAGISVRLILNHSYLQDETDAEHRPDPALMTVAQLAADPSERSPNREVYAALARCGVEVRMDLNPSAIWHQKFCVTDLRLTADGDPRQGAARGLLTGSANFTHTDCHTNLNHVLVFDTSACRWSSRLSSRRRGPAASAAARSASRPARSTSTAYP